MKTLWRLYLWPRVNLASAIRIKGHQCFYFSFQSGLADVTTLLHLPKFRCLELTRTTERGQSRGSLSMKHARWVMEAQKQTENTLDRRDKRNIFFQETLFCWIIRVPPPVSWCQGNTPLLRSSLNFINVGYTSWVCTCCCSGMQALALARLGRFV